MANSQRTTGLDAVGFLFPQVPRFMLCSQNGNSLAGYSMLGAGFQLSGLYNSIGADAYVAANKTSKSTTTSRNLKDLVKKAQSSLKEKLKSAISPPQSPRGRGGRKEENAS